MIGIYMFLFKPINSVTYNLFLKVRQHITQLFLPIVAAAVLTFISSLYTCMYVCVINRTCWESISELPDT